jgi:hypothetical protein
MGVENMPSNITPRVSPQYYARKIRENIESVEGDFNRMAYQSSYETRLHSELKTALEYLTALEKSLAVS